MLCRRGDRDSAGDRPYNAEAIGFMLRGFFEGLRRHIAFEREHVLPMIGIVD